MKKSLALFTLAVAALLIGTNALAEKERVNVGPENLKDAGFTVNATKRDDGMIDVTVTRDLSKARTFDAASDIELVRSATLEVNGPGATRVSCNLEPQAAEGAVSYRFRLAPDNLAHSRLTVSEIDDYKKSLKREHLIGGGTFFEIKLSDVIRERRARAAAPPDLDAALRVEVAPQGAINLWFDVRGAAEQSFDSSEYRYALLDKDGVQVDGWVLVPTGAAYHPVSLTKGKRPVTDYSERMIASGALKPGAEYYLVVSVRNLTGLAKFKAPLPHEAEPFGLSK